MYAIEGTANQGIGVIEDGKSDADKTAGSTWRALESGRARHPAHTRPGAHSEGRDDKVDDFGGEQAALRRLAPGGHLGAVDPGGHGWGIVIRSRWLLAASRFVEDGVGVMLDRVRRRWLEERLVPKRTSGSHRQPYPPRIFFPVSKFHFVSPRQRQKPQTRPRSSGA